jgi:hypothetical protein
VDDNIRRAWNHALALLRHIEERGGTFTRDNSIGSLSIRLDGAMISLDLDGVKPSDRLEHLLFTHGLPGASSQISKLVIAYLRRFAYSCAADGVVSAEFVAISQDGERIYVPVVDDGLLMISKDGVEKTKNVENPDKVLVEPRQGQTPSGSVRDVRVALDHFDERWWIANSHQASGDLAFTYELV